MQVILKPISHPNLEKIVVDDELFPVGRGDEPFHSYDPELVAHLSRRHARIFIEAEGVYVADLGSRNGTRLNDKPVEFRPTRVLAGDHINFAGQLEFEVDIIGQDADSDLADGEDLRLTLFPTEDDSSLLPIAISHFPFLIGKVEPAFSGSSDTQPEKLDFLSRRHAHFFKRGGVLYIEDLASTNGTTVNGESLDEHARPVANDDEVVFGGNYFAYRIALESDAEVAESAQARGGIEEEECHTIHVSAANTFLDIFCVDDPQEEETSPEKQEQGSASGETPIASAGARPGLVSRFRTFSQELKIAFDGDQKNHSKSLAIASTIGFLAIALAAFYYYSGEPIREMKAQLAAEQYLESAVSANNYLKEHPENEAVQLLATEALVKYFLGSWLQLMNEQNFTQAETLIESSRSLTADNETGSEVLDLLAWITKLQRFMVDRGGAEAAIQIYDHEEPMNSLLAWWDKNPDDNRSTMRLMVNYAPAFGELNAQAFSYLRSLRNEKSVYLTAIDKLKNKIEKRLEFDQPEALVNEIDRFSDKYPRLGGLERLRRDVNDYLAIQAALANNDRMQAAVLVQNAKFSTPPFIAKVEQLQATLLPSTEMAKRFSAASKAWRAGKIAETLDILDALEDERGGELATRELEAKRKIVANYANLQRFHGAPDYAARLITLYSSLDPIEDSHFKQALDGDFQRFRTQAKDRAESAWLEAESKWNSYRENGGIRGLLRLEEQISTRFREQAKLLSEANSKASYGKQTFELLDLDYSEQRSELLQQINAETELQRRSLSQLSMVLGPDILLAKLKMLDRPDESGVIQ